LNVIQKVSDGPLWPMSWVSSKSRTVPTDFLLSSRPGILGDEPAARLIQQRPAELGHVLLGFEDLQEQGPRSFDTPCPSSRIRLASRSRDRVRPPAVSASRAARAAGIRCATSRTPCAPPPRPAMSVRDATPAAPDAAVAVVLAGQLDGDPDFLVEQGGGLAYPRDVARGLRMQGSAACACRVPHGSSIRARRRDERARRCRTGAVR
jgi:hypothetical protein